MTAPHSSNSEIVTLVQARGPFASPGEAEAAVHATLLSLRAALHPQEWSELASELPAQLRGSPAATAEVAGPTVMNVDEFYARVGEAEPAPVARALEHAQIVCGVLAEAVLSPDTITRLQKHVPYLASLFEPRVLPPAPPPPVHADASAAHDLAGGRPGATHPIASSDPSTIAHEHSIARSDDPHEDTRLSSTQGTTQERQGRTLASGRPGARRRLADGR